MSLRRDDNTSQDRMDAINSETLEHYFTHFGGKQSQEFTSTDCNVDESGVPLVLNIVSEAGSRKVQVRPTGRKAQVMVVACGNASGQVIPPMLIFDAKKLYPLWT